MVSVSTKNKWLLQKYMSINAVATSVKSLFQFSRIFSYAIATSYHSKLPLFWVGNEINCKYGNNSRLNSRWSFLWNNTPTSRISLLNLVPSVIYVPSRLTQLHVLRAFVPLHLTCFCALQGCASYGSWSLHSLIACLAILTHALLNVTKISY